MWDGAEEEEDCSCDGMNPNSICNEYRCPYFLGLVDRKGHTVVQDSLEIEMINGVWSVDQYSPRAHRGIRWSYGGGASRLPCSSGTEDF